MVKKLQKIADKKAAAPAGLLDNDLAGAVKASAQQIWLAGMGAFAKAQAEGGKVFESLVKEGMSLQRKTQSAAEERLSEVAGRMTAMADGVTSKAGERWDKLEGIFEDRVAKALAKLGVPSSKDVEALIARIDALHAEVARLNGRAGKAAKPAATRAPAAKRSRKPKAEAPAAAADANGGVKPAAKRAARRKAAPAA